MATNRTTDTKLLPPIVITNSLDLSLTTMQKRLQQFRPDTIVTRAATVRQLLVWGVESSERHFAIQEVDALRERKNVARLKEPVLLEAKAQWERDEERRVEYLRREEEQQLEKRRRFEEEDERRRQSRQRELEEAQAATLKRGRPKKSKSDSK